MPRKIFKDSVPITSIEELQKIRISPSKLDSFTTCPRKFAAETILALKSEAGYDLKRGSVVHETLDEFFDLDHKQIPSGDGYRESYIKRAKKILDKNWEELVIPLNLDADFLQRGYEETEKMVMRFINRFCDQIDDAMAVGKYDNERICYYIFKPKFRELWLDDLNQIELSFDSKRKIVKKDDRGQEKIPLKDSLNVGGFVDAIEKDFDGNITIIDYKTSTLYRNDPKDNYVTQLGMYAYMFEKQTGITPKYVAINFLKYDRSHYYLVTPSFIKMATDKVKEMRNYINNAGLDIKNYAAKTNKFCDGCPFYKECLEMEKPKCQNQ